MSKYSRAQRRQLERDNAKQPAALRALPESLWPAGFRPPALLRVFRSREFLVQEFSAPPPAKVRLSICRAAVSGDNWTDGITWNELQHIKHECGYGDRDAIEIYPADVDVVNVANMRHLWVMLEKVPFAWRRP